MSLPRGIRTRILEALINEARNCYDQESLGLRDLYGGLLGKWKIRGWLLRPPSSIAGPRQLDILMIPLHYEPDVSQVTNTTYDYELRWCFPMNDTELVIGTNQNTYADEIEQLRIWLFNGGSVPNRNARLQDPDNPGALINNGILRWVESAPQPVPNSDGSGFTTIEVPVLVSFETRENRTGVRA